MLKAIKIFFFGVEKATFHIGFSNNSSMSIEAENFTDAYFIALSKVHQAPIFISPSIIDIKRVTNSKELSVGANHQEVEFTMSKTVLLLLNENAHDVAKNLDNVPMQYKIKSLVWKLQQPAEKSEYIDTTFY